jgi:hypothetical protein
MNSFVGNDLRLHGINPTAGDPRNRPSGVMVALLPQSVSDVATVTQVGSSGLLTRPHMSTIVHKEPDFFI